MLLLLSIMLERDEAVVTYEKYFGIYAADNVSEFRSLIAGIVISSICTFAISYSTSWCIRVNGATTYRLDFPLFFNDTSCTN
jgi:hypothetical protein